MSFLTRIFGGTDRRRALAPLYQAMVGFGRDPGWYRDGKVPDSVDGRFDMMAAITALVLLRLEADGEKGREPSILLTEAFIDDMDGSLRQIGIGEHSVGKHIGRLMSALGGRLEAFRAAGPEGFRPIVRRNIFHDSPPSDEALDWVTERLEAFAAALARQPLDALLAGRLTTP